MVKIIIADDHVVLRQGLKALLNSVGEWEVVGEASDGLEVVPLVEKYSPQIVIVDLSMPNLGGIEAIGRLQRSHCKPSIVVLSAREDDLSVTEALKAGAKAYVTKSSTSEELQFAIRAVLKGQSYLSPAVCGAVVRSGENGGIPKSPIDELSAREREVMKLLAEGRPNREVAKTLHISARTVDSHRANILKKLGVTSNAELVQLAFKAGLLE